MTLEFAGEVFDPARLDGLTARAAAVLAAHGVRPGEVVAVHLRNQPAYAVLVWAVARLGAVLAPLNTRLTPAELAWQMAQVRASFLVTADASASAWAGAARVLSTADLETAAPPLTAYPPFDLNAVQGIFFTSGTTGFPKGACLTFGNHLASARASAQHLGTGRTDRWLVVLPLYHIGGLSVLFRARHDGSNVVLHDGFDVEAVRAALLHDRISHVSLVPTLLHRLLQAYPDFTAPPGLRLVLLGGAAAPAPLIEQALALGWPLALTYGLTEACSQVTTALPAQVRAQPGTVGRPLPGTHVSVVDATGQPVAPGTVGEIVVRGPTVMHGYFGHARLGGTLFTGDIGYLSEAGDVWVLTRRTDLIVTGGENVYPDEVERVLLQHPGVQAVCVVGVPDPEWGQRVAAAIVPAAPAFSAEAALVFARQQLAGYKVPRQVAVVETLPYTASGKLKRVEVAAWLAAQ